VLLGGGQRFFEADSRPDGVDLVSRMRRRAVYVDTPEALAALDTDTVRALVGLFAENNPGPVLERAPALVQLTDAALHVLEKDQDGFFLMVEGSQIDWRGHENAPLERVVAEVQDFDLAIRRGLEFQAERPNTLLLVLADHSTGGLALHADEDGWFRAHYTTKGHTAEMIPLFARGPGAEAFGGIMNNDQVGRLLRQLVRDEQVPVRAARATTESGSR
jgi:alkaline phosphatase